MPVHAVAGIGNPQRFFDALKAKGLDVISHPFSDHHDFLASDCEYNDDLPVLMTEKDAVKCQKYHLKNTWVVPAITVLPDRFYFQLIDKLKQIGKG